MKFVLVLLVVVGVLWLMLGRKRGAAPPSGSAGQAKRPQALLACAHCGLQLPAGDAVLGGSHVYCSDAHRAKGPAPVAPPRSGP